MIGASIWDSDNRWITIHGTNTLVVRDCVGYRSAGPWFFHRGRDGGREHSGSKPGGSGIRGKAAARPGFSHGPQRGAGFWWANSGNAFMGNVAVECDEYGFRFDAPEAPGVELVAAGPRPRRPATQG